MTILDYTENELKTLVTIKEVINNDLERFIYDNYETVKNAFPTLEKAEIREYILKIKIAELLTMPKAKFSIN